MESIRDELQVQLQSLNKAGKLVEAQRLEQRTLFDLEMMQEMGFCNGIENYSRHLTGRAPGQPPPTLIDYFPKEFLLIIDESHQTVPQIGGMYRGDRSRKETLVEFGFRLPSSTTVPCVSMSFGRSTIVSSSSVRHLVTTNSNRRRVLWLSKSFVRPDSSTHS